MISIIIPVYNAKKYLRRCLDSVLAQTYTNIEILLVDDGSVDGSDRICDEYQAKDSRIVVFHKKNGGVSSARNLALDHMQGQYGLFVDADDWIDPNMCEFMLNTAEVKDVKMVVSLLVNHAEQEKSEMKQEDSIEAKLINVKNEFSFLDQYATGTAGGILYHKECIRSNRFDTDIFVGEDTLFFARALKRCTVIAYVPYGFYNYVEYAESAAHGKIDEKKMTNLIAWSRIAELFADNERIYQTARGAYGRQCAYFRHRLYKISQNKEPYEVVLKKGIKENFKFMLRDKSLKKRIYYWCILVIPAIYTRIKGYAERK